MFTLDDDTLVYSASDMAAAASCEFAVLQALDVKLGWAQPLEVSIDATAARAGELGDAHERRVLGDLINTHGVFDPVTGRGVAQIDRPARTTREALTAKHAETLDVLNAGADVVYQGGFFDGRFAGWSDFLIRSGVNRDGRPRFAVYDTKLARREKPTALLQVAAYADQLISAGIAVDDEVHLILGSNITTSHPLIDLLPVYRERRRRLQRLLDSHRDRGVPVAWGVGRVRACGRCDACTPQIETTRDVLLVAGLRQTQRARLLDAGVRTIDALAARTTPVPGVGDQMLERLRAQAQLQVRQDANGHDERPVFEMFNPQAIASLPAPSDGDIFFDFEGDPLFAAGQVSADGTAATWGLEYLFGLVEAPVGAAAPVFNPFWAHDRAQEKQALVDFLGYVERRRAQYPDMHIYHYAPYERTALLRLAGRHGVGEDVVDELLSAGVLVDLYATVRASVRTGQRSYSLKKLEPLYMDESRTGEVTNAGASIDEYAHACALRDSGDLAGWVGALDEIASYNEYDCVSTLHLRNWLLRQAAAVGVAPGRIATAAHEVNADSDSEEAPEHDVVVGKLREYADDAAELDDGARTPAQQAVALLAASLGYHWREHKPFWWSHFDRLVADPAEWTDARSTLVADSVEVVEDWFTPPRARTLRRILRMSGRLEPGSELRPGTSCFAVYDPPGPDFMKKSDADRRGWTEPVTVLEVSSQGDGRSATDTLLVVEQLKATQAPHEFLPMGLSPAAPPNTALIAKALHALGEQIAAELPHVAAQPSVDLARRVPPRTRSHQPLPTPGSGPGAVVDAITAAVLDLDGSYLAVQGPPGTGKTHTGSHVIANLVAAGWKVGVVAQSHAVVENLLSKTITSGVPADRVMKKARAGADGQVPWFEPKDTAAFEGFFADQAGGFVMGGTMWDFTNARRIPADGFDLLVIDEAGQFSLANTFAVSAAAKNLLLLGDPQQLPQVSQGTHPEPVDTSALGWLTAGHDTLPAHLGYFLAQTWRMHPQLCTAVSNLSYDGRLLSVEQAAARHLDGVSAGVRAVLVEHDGNSVSSREEALEVLAQANDLIGRTWHDPAAGAPRALTPADILVVAAYNAQVWTIKRVLAAAGLEDMQVGTVDKFQGQEAPVVIVSMAASSPEDVPRGMEFLLNRNRLNVAISRGKYAAVIVRSERLTDYLPSTPQAMAELGAFITLSHP